MMKADSRHLGDVHVRGSVSVVIPCFNYANFVGAAIRSAMAQSYRPLRIVVVNDGSTDGFEKAVAAFGNQIDVINQANLGVSAARNRGIEASKSEFVAFFDADDMWEPEKIARQVAVLQSRSDCALVHTRAAFIGCRSERIARTRSAWQEHPAEGSCTLELLAHNTIIASSVLVRRSALDPEPFRGTQCEDWDLWLRLSLKSRIAFIDDALTLYRVHGSNKSLRAQDMHRGTVGVLDRLLKEDLQPEIRHAARRHRREAIRWLAHSEYENGNLKEAGCLFAKAARRWAARRSVASASHFCPQAWDRLSDTGGSEGDPGPALHNSENRASADVVPTTCHRRTYLRANRTRLLS
jgi:glycosyltransferase involved in cell wall biosynthesis